MDNRFPKKSTLRSIDFSHHLSHYLGVFWRSKWYIIIAGPIVVAVTLTCLIKFYNISPQLSATALIGIENASDITAVKEAGSIGNGRADLITSPRFLKDIVDSLSLNLQVNKYTRSELFDSVHTNSTVEEGTYKFIVNNSKNGQYLLTFTKDGSGGEKLILNTGKLSTLSSLSAPGIRVVFSKSFLNKPHNFSFSIVNTGIAIDNFISKLSVIDANPQKSNYNITISLLGNDYKLISECVNTIADVFVNRNLSFRNRKSKGAIDVLQKQYETAYLELNNAEVALKDFRTANPTVGLSQRSEQTVAAMSALESSSFDFQSSLNEGLSLQNRISATTGENQMQVASEIVAFLNSKSYHFAPILQADLTQLIAEKQELVKNHYSVEHPLFQENQRKFNNVEKQIEKALADFNADLQLKIRDQSKNIGSMNNEIRTLPGKELQLAQLQRKQRICSEIFTAVLNRYNQAKIADVVEVADVFVMDYSLPPVPPPLKLFQYLAFSLLLGIVFSFGPIIFLDKIDKTARTVFEFEQLSDKLVLESIPIISPLMFTTKSDSSSSHIGFPLFTQSNTKEHYFVGEVLKALRTKIMMKFHEIDDKSLVVTSIERGAGKTTIASNLASAIAQMNISTILVDGDMRCGRVHEIFSCQNNNGFQELLSSDHAINETTIAKYIQPTLIPSLSIISSGRTEDNPSELLASSRFMDIKKILSKSFDMIIMDCPPLGAVTDAAVVYQHFTYYCIIAKAGATNINDLMKKLKEYPLVEKKVLGCILNFSALDKNLKYYKNTKYYS